MNEPLIHPTAIVAPGARIGEGVRVGPYAVIGDHVEIGAGTQVGPHAVLDGHTTIGRDNRIFQFASVGAPPQDKKYAGEPTRLVIGDRNTFREFVTLNTGTVQDGGVTTVGSDNWIMAYVHVAHDCHVGDQTIIANAVQLGGHVRVGDWAIVGGVTGVHQFSRIGAHAMVGFSSRLAQDLPPFVTAAGNPAKASGVNLEGLRRRGFTAPRIAVVKRMYRLLFREGLPLAEAMQRIAPLADETPEAAAEVQSMLDFLAQAARGLVR